MKQKEKQNKKAILTMGLPAAGKSTILRKNYKDFVDNSVIIDPDIEKKKHPDYDPKNPQEIHQWSKKQAKKTMMKAIVEDKDMIIDGTGTNLEKMVKYIQDLHGAGYEIELVYVRVSLKTSLKRNRERERVVPEEIIREKAEYITGTFEVLSERVDILSVYNNEANVNKINSGKNPQGEPK